MTYADPPIHPAKCIDALTAALYSEVEKGAVVVNTCAKTGLKLYTYSKQCVYDRMWNDTNVLARGLILDTHGQIVALPFPKFFNHGERESAIPAEDFEVFEKLDGSLIIAFFHDGDWNCATKGSFISEQAKWAQEKLRSMNTTYLDPNATYLFEAIYPQNRIVINYDYEDLVLLAAYEGTGEEFSYAALQTTARNLECRMAKRYEGKTFADLVELAKTLPPTEEGWVVRFASGLRLKIKGEEYLRLHRMVSRLTPLSVWEAMWHGDDLDAFRKDLPEEFWGDFDSLRSLIQAKIDAITFGVQREAAVRVSWSDKEVGLDLGSLSPDVRPFIFSWRKEGKLDRRARDTLFRFIRPTGNRLEGYRPSSSVTRILEESV